MLGVPVKGWVRGEVVLSAGPIHHGISQPSRSCRIRFAFIRKADCLHKTLEVRGFHERAQEIDREIVGSLGHAFRCGYSPLPAQLP
jgi:hypothetical protein